jgi:hypothetical protein
MKNVITCYLKKQKDFHYFESYLKAQIDNSIELGWSTDSIILVTNFDFEFMGVKAMKMDLNPGGCLTGSKTFSTLLLLKHGMNEPFWAHDLDAWQQIKFDMPEFTDIGVTTYSVERKINGGSMFIRPSAIDMVQEIVNEIERQQSKKEEPIIRKILNLDQYKGRITIVDQTFNVGCSGFWKRYYRASKPIHVFHFHPEMKGTRARVTMAIDENGQQVMDDRTKAVFARYWPNTTPTNI